MRSPVDGAPSVDGVLGVEVRGVRAALQQDAQGADVAVPARAVERETHVQDLLVGEARGLHSDDDGHGGVMNDGIQIVVTNQESAPN